MRDSTRRGRRWWRRRRERKADTRLLDKWSVGYLKVEVWCWSGKLIVRIVGRWVAYMVDEDGNESIEVLLGEHKVWARRAGLVTELCIGESGREEYDCRTAQFTSGRSEIDSDFDLIVETLLDRAAIVKVDIS